MKFLNNIIFSNIVRQKENFVENNEKSITYYQNIALIITFMITQILILLFGKFLWNNYLVRTVTIIKPIDNIFEILALSLLFNLIF